MDVYHNAEHLRDGGEEGGGGEVLTYLFVGGVCVSTIIVPAVSVG